MTTIALGAAQAESLKGTRAADRDGRPLVLHHGTLHVFDRFGRTNDLGYHFGTRPQALKRLRTLTPAERRATGAGEPRIISAAVVTRNPLVLPDDPMAWVPGHVADVFRRFLTPDEHRSIPEAKGAGMSVVRDALRRAGHDAVVYRNQAENTGRAVEWSWLVLDASDIVVLGRDLPDAVAAWPDGTVSGPGIDADRETRTTGGLRTRDGRLRSRADALAYRDAVLDVCGRTLDGPVFVPSSSGPASGEINHDLDGRLVRVRVLGESGKALVWVQPADARRLEAQGRSAASVKGEFHGSPAFVAALDGLGGFQGFTVDRNVSSSMPTAVHVSRWMPGEPMSFSTGRLESLLGGVVSVLGAEPRTGPRP